MRRAISVFAGLALAVVLFLATALFRYAHPQVDDLFRAARVKEHGVVASVRLEYTTWSGRWLGTGISYLASSLVDLRRHYGLLLSAIALVSLFAACVFVGGVLTRELPRRWALAFSISLMALLWAGLSDPGDAFYWFTGAVENQLGVALGLALVGWLLHMPIRLGLSSARAARLAAVAALAFALPGIHELYGAILAFVLCVGAMSCLTVRSKRLEWWVGVIACVAGLLAVALAPGNIVRINYSPPPRSLTTLFRLVHLVPLFTRWIVSPLLLAASLAFVLHPAVRRLQPSWRLSKIPVKWVIPAATLAVEVFGFAACYWLVGGVHPRTLSALYEIFLLGWFATLFAWTRGVSEEPFSPLRERVRQACVLAFGVALVFSANTRRALEDLRWRAGPYDHAFRQRDAFIEGAAARGDLHVGVPAYPTEPVMFLHWDLVNEPTDFRNWHYTHFYRVSSLRVDAVTGPENPYGRILPPAASRAGSSHAPSISLLTAVATDLSAPMGLSAQWNARPLARWMSGPQARIEFDAPPGARSAVLELRALSMAPGRTLEARMNGDPVLVHTFQAAGEWHAFLSKPFPLKPGLNRLVLRAGSVARRGDQDLAVLFDEIALTPR